MTADHTFRIAAFNWLEQQIKIHGDGLPLVSNGLSLCKLHHAAFDKNIVGISPDYLVEIREDILAETDGPMLKHGLQGLHKTKIITPGKNEFKPDRKFLEKRFMQFKEAV